MSSSPSILILVVIYNESLSLSSTIKSLISNKTYLSSVKLLIWDNSSTKQDYSCDIEQYVNDIEIVHTPENTPLAKVYNIVRESKLKNEEFCLLLDQDTIIPDNYFTSLFTAIEENPNINLFLPIIKSHNHIVSPGDLFLFKGKYWEEEQFGLVEAKNRLAINSGMFIKSNYFKNNFKGYNKELKFYGVDSYFMLEYAKINKFFITIPVIIEHDSALLDNDEEIIKKAFRFNDLLDGWIIINKRNFYVNFLYKIYIIYISLKWSLKYKNLIFLQKGLSKIFK